MPARFSARSSAYAEPEPVLVDRPDAPALGTRTVVRHEHEDRVVEHAEFLESRDETPSCASKWVRNPANTSWKRAKSRRSSADSPSHGCDPRRSVGQLGAGGDDAEARADGRTRGHASAPSRRRSGRGSGRTIRSSRGAGRAWRPARSRGRTACRASRAAGRRPSAATCRRGPRSGDSRPRAGAAAST